MRRAVKILAILAFAASSAGCAKEDAPKAEHVVSIEDGYIDALDGITKAMQDDGPPDAVIGRVRARVDASRDGIRDAVKKLNIDVLAMNEADRDAWRAKARTRLAGSLDAYARAQADLMKRLDDAQKWELGEILRTLQ